VGNSNHLFEDKHKPLATAGWDIHTSEVTSSRARSQRPIHILKVIAFYGNNIISSEEMNGRNIEK